MRRLFSPAVSAIIEPLESRQLLAGEPWGAIPQLIGQNGLVARYPQLDGSGQTVAVIDTGVDYNHPALGGGFGPGFKVIGGWDFVDNDSDPMDDNGHGTAVASVIAGNSFVFRGARYQGLAPNANIVALRIFDASGSGAVDSYIEAALQWVQQHRSELNIVAVNMSLGGGGYTGERSRSPYGDELSSLRQAGVFIAAASGNSGVTAPPMMLYPAADPNAYAIGSVNGNDVISDFTMRSRYLDLLAPGENVPVAFYNPSTGGRGYRLGSGTSFASPYVAAAAALLKQANASLSPALILQVLKNKGVKNVDGDKEVAPYTNLTFRRLKIDAAVAEAIRMGQQPTTPPGGDSHVMTGSHNDMVFDARGVLHLAYYDPIDGLLKYMQRSTEGTWSEPRIIDGRGGAGKFVSIAVDGNGRVAMAYWAEIGGSLRYAVELGNGFAIKTVDARGVGKFASLAFDTANRPAIAYYDYRHGDLRFARPAGLGWKVSTIASQGNTGAFSTLAYNAVKRSWTIAYHDRTKGLYRMAQQKPGGSWSFSAIDRSVKGGRISMAFDARGGAMLSYFHGGRADLKFAQFNGRTWSTRTLASAGEQGQFNSLVIDPATGAPTVYYFNATGKSVDKVTVGETIQGPTRVVAGGLFVSAATDPNSGATVIVFMAGGTRELRPTDV